MTGAPNSGNGSLVLIDGPYYQDIQLSADIILSGSADNGGLVFGYLDKNNYWLFLANRASGTYQLWQVSGGTWNARGSGGTVASGGGTFSLSLEMRSGSVQAM